MDYHSGHLDENNETKSWSRACDHLNVNKFPDAEDQDFGRLIDALEEMIKNGPTLIEKRMKGMYA